MKFKNKNNDNKYSNEKNNKNALRKNRDNTDSFQDYVCTAYELGNNLLDARSTRKEFSPSVKKDIKKALKALLPRQVEDEIIVIVDRANEKTVVSTVRIALFVFSLLTSSIMAGITIAGKKYGALFYLFTALLSIIAMYVAGSELLWKQKHPTNNTKKDSDEELILNANNSKNTNTTNIFKTTLFVSVVVLGLLSFFSLLTTVLSIFFPAERFGIDLTPVIAKTDEWIVSKIPIIREYQGSQEWFFAGDWAVKYSSTHKIGMVFIVYLSIVYSLFYVLLFVFAMIVLVVDYDSGVKTLSSMLIVFVFMSVFYFFFYTKPPRYLTGTDGLTFAQQHTNIPFIDLFNILIFNDMSSFPSQHVALSTFVLLMTIDMYFRANKKHLENKKKLLLVLILLNYWFSSSVMMAIVFLNMHYIVDVVGGVIVSIIIYAYNKYMENTC